MPLLEGSHVVRGTKESTPTGSGLPPTGRCIGGHGRTLETEYCVAPQGGIRAARHWSGCYLWSSLVVSGLGVSHGGIESLREKLMCFPVIPFYYALVILMSFNEPSFCPSRPVKPSVTGRLVRPRSCIPVRFSMTALLGGMLSIQVANTLRRAFAPIRRSLTSPQCTGAERRTTCHPRKGDTTLGRASPPILVAL
ncbi:hypothetical protein BJV78DRAFT_182573 [Lactifluus subvellereus]|nr:hypothetical protein BJV78DRAFT_182573 [Lactifluus subvellereus]